MWGHRSPRPPDPQGASSEAARLLESGFAPRPGLLGTRLWVSGPWASECVILWDLVGGEASLCPFSPFHPLKAFWGLETLDPYPGLSWAEGGAGLGLSADRSAGVRTAARGTAGGPGVGRLSPALPVRAELPVAHS